MEHHYPKKMVEMVKYSEQTIQHLRKGHLITLLPHTRDPATKQYQPD